MENLPLILMGTFIISLILSLMSMNSIKTKMQIVNEMGIGYNLGNLFDCYTEKGEIKYPDEQIILLGNTIPTKQMITSIKKSGFKTIRFPITWKHFIDDYGNTNSDWMKRIKEVVNWIIDSNMYCIINVHNDAILDNWIFKEQNSKEKYINIWKQISNEFKIYDEHLIFESLNEVELKIGEDNEFSYNIINNLNQAFVDTVRNSGGYNPDRLLLISGWKLNFEFALISNIKMPIDLKNKLGISLHYYFPLEFAKEPDDNPWKFLHSSGFIFNILPLTIWGTESDYNQVVTNFEYLKKNYIQNGIPVILSEIGVITEQQKDIKSIREYLYTIFSLSLDYNYIVPCLWDTSSKLKGDFNYYNRETFTWYDEKIKDNFIKISKHKNIKPIEYFIMKKYESKSETESDGSLNINIGIKKPIKVSFNVKIKLHSLNDVQFRVVSKDKSGNYFIIFIEGKSGKKQYDGTYTYSIDVSNRDCHENIRLLGGGNEFINNKILIIEYEENFLSFDYEGYKMSILNYI